MFDAVSRNSHDDIFYEDDIWPGVDQNGYKIQATLQRIFFLKADFCLEITIFFKGGTVLVLPYT